jgi:hypothetical protein
MIVSLAGRIYRLQRNVTVDLVDEKQEFDTRKEQGELLEGEMERCLEEVRLLRRKLV